MANRKPLHAPLRSKQTVSFRSPRSRCTRHAAEGAKKSEDRVATMHTPISSGFTPAFRSAILAASRHMDFRTSQPIIDALKARAEEGIWGYTARPESYFAAIRSWQKRRNGWEIDQSLMSWSLGVVQTISACVRLFTPEGGSVLIQTPVYSEFYDMTEAWGREVVESPFVEKDGAWAVDWADFEAKLRQCDLFLLCNPHNPLGIVWTPEELRRMVALCEKYHVVLVSDEIHSDLIFHGKKHTPTATVAENVITCISGTKTFNLAGLQASAAVFPNAHRKEVYDHFWQRMEKLRHHPLH